MSSFCTYTNYVLQRLFDQESDMCHNLFRISIPKSYILTKNKVDAANILRKIENQTLEIKNKEKRSDFFFYLSVLFFMYYVIVIRDRVESTI